MKCELMIQNVRVFILLLLINPF